MVIETRKGELVIDTDDHIKPETSIEALSKLRAAFGKEGTVTAGNASGIVDGAAAMLLGSEDAGGVLGLTPRARIRGFSSIGTDPTIMLTGPAPSAEKVLKRCGMTTDDIDLFELNEAFASQCLYCRDTLGIDPEKYNVNGGSISIGHPFGMTGARCVGHLLLEGRRRKAKWGVVTMCIGGGQGAAGLFEIF